MAISAEQRQRYAVIFKVAILAAIYVIAFSQRMFAVIRFESVIHEFDPYFNFRTTKFLTHEGFYNFHNWFDDRAWYPLGRIVGGTIYPGLMMTAAMVYWLLNLVNITMPIRNVCVFLAPWMASNTALVGYALTKEAMTDFSVPADSAARKNSERKGDAAGVLAAALVGMVPGYVSRSVAGSYDNEGVAIFALLATYCLWMKAVNRGSMFYATLTCLSYFYMVSAWGGYIFIINLIPLYVLVMLLSGRYSHRLYVAYSSFYVLGTLLSMQVTFVGFQPVYSSEHMAAFGVFGLLQLYCFQSWVQSMLPADMYATLWRQILVGAGGLAAAGIAVGLVTGYLAPWTGRFYSLLDPTYAKAHIPIISSVSEHQPTSWGSYFFDLHFVSLVVPAGMYFCVTRPTDGKLFLVTYGMTAVYFSGVMVRLMLTLAPAACMLAAIAVSETLSRHVAYLNQEPAADEQPDQPRTKQQARAAKQDTTLKQQRNISLGVVGLVTTVLVFFSWHCVWVTSEAYSSPSIVLAAAQHDGSRRIFDDFREGYWWLRQNTPEDARVMSWWDYGYQITAIANRTVLVDNNTWNNTHIATVGRAMASPEHEAYPIMKSLDVDYVLVIFGGMTGYSSDDINKFLWMVRIGGGVYPHIVEADYFTDRGEYSMGADGSPTMLNSLMYKLSYYRFGLIATDPGRPMGFDRARGVEIGNKNFELEHVEEAFTSEHWIVRIYRVLPETNRF